MEGAEIGGGAREQGGEGAKQFAAAFRQPDGVLAPGGGGVVGGGGGEKREQRVFERCVGVMGAERGHVGHGCRGGGRREAGREGEGGREGGGEGKVPEQRRHLLDRGGAREGDGVDATIPEAAIPDRRDRRFQHRRAPVEGGFGDVFRLASAAVFGGEAGDGGRVVAALAGVFGGMGAQQAAADIGVEGLAGDPGLARGFGGGEEGDHVRAR